MISIIIPAYNESNRIEKVLGEYAKYFLDKHQEFEIIVVCDGTDNTAEVVSNISKKYTNVKLLEYSYKLGKGGGIIEGFKSSKGDIVGFVDADDAVTPAQYEILINSVSDCDCVIGSRRMNGSVIIQRQPLIREVLSKCLNLLVNGLFNLKIKDTQCGAKIFKRNVIEKVLPKLKLTGFEFDIELLWKIKNENFLIKEVPITWSHTDESSFLLKYIPKMFINLIRLRVGLLKGI